MNRLKLEHVGGGIEEHDRPNAAAFVSRIELNRAAAFQLDHSIDVQLWLGLAVPNCLIALDRRGVTKVRSEN